MNRTVSNLLAGLLALGLPACNQPAPGTIDPTNEQRGAAPPEKPAAAVAADAVLGEKVKTALVAAPGLNAQGLDVAAADGVVTLYGTVEAKSEAERLALLAMSVDGVRSVVNNLVVVSGS